MFLLLLRFSLRSDRELSGRHSPVDPLEHALEPARELAQERLDLLRGSSTRGSADDARWNRLATLAPHRRSRRLCSCCYRWFGSSSSSRSFLFFLSCRKSSDCSCRGRARRGGRRRRRSIAIVACRCRLHLCFLLCFAGRLFLRLALGHRRQVRKEVIDVRHCRPLYSKDERKARCRKREEGEVSEARRRRRLGGGVERKRKRGRKK